MFARIPRIAFLLLFLLAVVFVVNVAAAPLAQEGVLPLEVDEYLAAAGVGVVILLLVEIAKRFGWLADGLAGKVTVIASMVAYAALYIAGIFGFDIQAGTAQVVVEALTTLLKLALTVITAIGGYKTLRAAQVLNPLASRR
jgi:hypothetical protein